MVWMETIHIRSHSYQDRDEALETFKLLDVGAWPENLKNIGVFINFAWDGDLYIVMHWNGIPPREGKTPLGHRLARAFSRFGQANHAVWVKESGLGDEHKKGEMT